MPSPSLVRELTRLRFTRQEKDQQLSALRSSVVQQRTARSFRRRVGRFDDDVFAFSAETTTTRVGSASRLALAVTEERYQVAALELATVEMEVELVHWRDWLGDAAHERESCDDCLSGVVDKVGNGVEGLSKTGKNSGGRSGERELSPLNWEKKGGASGKRSGRVDGRRAESVASED